MVTPQAFGQLLRRQREKRRLSLQQIAAQTKVHAPLFASLEQGDCTRWPGGIYSRGYVRAYALAVGLDPDETVALFCECFPDKARPAPIDPEVVAEDEAKPSTPFEKLRSAVAAWVRLVAPARR